MKMKNIIKKQQKQYLSVLCQLHYLLSVYALSVQHTQQIKTMQKLLWIFRDLPMITVWNFPTQKNSA